MNAIGFVKEGKYIGLRELRENLSSVVKSQRPFFLTDHGKPVKAMISYQYLLELLEMLDELKDKALTQKIAMGRKEYQAGGWVPARSA